MKNVHTTAYAVQFDTTTYFMYAVNTSTYTVYYDTVEDARRAFAEWVLDDYSDFDEVSLWLWVDGGIESVCEIK